MEVRTMHGPSAASLTHSQVNVKCESACNEAQKCAQAAEPASEAIPTTLTWRAGALARPAAHHQCQGRPSHLLCGAAALTDILNSARKMLITV